jgi:23S rRNA (pseudouridine1915-N3)-methyltransferase
MKFNLITIGNKMPKWVEEASNEYLRRINIGQYSCKITTLKSYKNPNHDVATILDYEANKILDAIPNNCYLIALDERGKKYSTQKFKLHIEDVMHNYSNIVFIIGGADGLHQKVKQRSNLLLQLSDFTYPHALVRVILLEQIYRIISILQSHPYHRE